MKIKGKACLLEDNELLYPTCFDFKWILWSTEWYHYLYNTQTETLFMNKRSQPVQARSTQLFTDFYPDTSPHCETVRDKRFGISNSN